MSSISRSHHTSTRTMQQSDDVSSTPDWISYCHQGICNLQFCKEFLFLYFCSTKYCLVYHQKCPVNVNEIWNSDLLSHISLCISDPNAFSAKRKLCNAIWHKYIINSCATVWWRPTYRRGVRVPTNSRPYNAWQPVYSIDTEFTFIQLHLSYLAEAFSLKVTYKSNKIQLRVRNLVVLCSENFRLRAEGHDCSFFFDQGPRRKASDYHVKHHFQGCENIKLMASSFHNGK